MLYAGADERAWRTDLENYLKIKNSKKERKNTRMTRPLPQTDLQQDSARRWGKRRGGENAKENRMRRAVACMSGTGAGDE